MVESTQKQELTFSQYPEIENYFHKDMSTFINSNEQNNDLWVATEKIHGTNFSFITDGTQVLHGKRTSYLKDNDSFMNFQVIAKKYDQSVLKLFQNIKIKIPNIKLIKVFGEFYGGTYPNVQSEQKKQKCIQQGIYYCPDLEFEAFDIFYEHTLNSETVKSILTYTEAIEFLEQVKIPCAQILKQGTLKELMSTLNADTLESQIYIKFGLPKIENNLAEGYVIKPNKAAWFPDGERISIKIKNKKFDEISQSAKVKEVKSQIANTELPEDQAQSLARFLQYLNINRINGVVTKLKDEEVHYKGLVVSKLMADAQKDFEKTENNNILKPFGTGKKIILAKAKSEAEKVYEEFMKTHQK